MKNAWIIARRDFRSYFTTPIAYVVIGLFLGIIGYMFFSILSYFVQSSMFSMGRQTPSITEGIVRPLFQNMNVWLLMLLPAITMRLFAEDRKQHTLELLITSPVTLFEIILGKFFAALMLVLVMLAITSVYVVILFATGNPDWGPILTSYIGITLVACCYLSVGILFSAMTENQIVAAILTLAVCLFFWIISWASHSAGPVWGEVFSYLSLIGHFGNFNSGVLNTTDVFYYLSFTGVSLFLTHRVLDSYRWS